MKDIDTKAMKFAVYICNDGYPAALEIGKLYRVIPDAVSESQGYLRVIDESGEDYGYRKDRFFPMDIPHALQEALKQAA